jgi:hypothetical protein
MDNNHSQSLAQTSSPKEILVQSFEENLKAMTKQQLDLAIKKLNFLCLNFDPYSDHISTEVENILSEYKLSDYISNPFEFTNIVLQILDKTENTIKSRVH